MNTEINNTINASGADAQYDVRAKRLLSNKGILAHILIKTVDEFMGMNPKDVQMYIEGEPFVNIVPIEPGLTNEVKEQYGQQVVGMNTENAQINEGLVRFDIIFYVRMRDGISQIIVNLEAQKDEPTGYNILNRAIFYVSRLVSSQKERDFVNMNYNDIKRVFSIWVCLNMTENTMVYVHLVKDDLLGDYQWKGGLDLLNIVMIGIADELPEHDDEYEMHRLLCALLSSELSVEEKLEIMETEYSIPIDDKIREDVSEMCNLSQGILEKGEARGEARGEVRGETKIIINMYKNGFTMEQMALAANKTVEEIEIIISQNESVMV